MDYLDKTASLTPSAKRIICDKATEYPHTGSYNEVVAQGTYLCRRCGIALFRGSSQFHSGCGWPSFDGELAGTIARVSDKDGLRTEIVCDRCQAHLGHVFTGEYLTHANLRHCVNSASLDFVSNNDVLDTEEAIVAGGCFWGVEHYLNQLSGVLKVESGYIGGHLVNPDYQQICHGDTGHYEAIRVIYAIEKIDYYSVLKRFFEIHDPTQQNGQGPDIGFQYQSAVFYFNMAQKQVATDLLQQLRRNGYQPVTKLLAAQPFWPAEEYHQNYYAKQGSKPYCHRPVARFFKE